MHYFKKVGRSFVVTKEEKEELTFNEVEEGIYFRGHNLWLLVFSMIIACIGLNINSQAAIIGAMLISPLMGPIVGMGFGLSIGNRHLLSLGFYNWILMIVVALASSTVYFFITPFHSPTEQLEGFKNATIFDCLLAFFGGIAWFLGITRKEAIKVIAGVAVATACIPPLCTAGYGIANWNWDFFSGGFYFYLINCFYIGAGTWILSAILKYPKYYLENSPKGNKKISFIISILSAILIIPSIYITKSKWEKENLEHSAEQYVEDIKRSYPELGIVGYESFFKKKEKFVKITLLNDSASVNPKILSQSNAMKKDIHIIWQYAPNYRTSATNIEKMQKEIVKLQKEILELKTQNKK